MDQQFSESSVSALLQGKSVLVTGATGFIGKVLVEKLLRCVPSIDCIFVLIRPQKGETPQQRLEQEILSTPLFLKYQRNYNLSPMQLRSVLLQKIVPIAGDITHKNCGIDQRDIQELSSTVAVVFHCAASVSFDDRIDRAIDLNILGALRMFELVLSFSAVKSFVHVSTAYVNSNRNPSTLIKEKMYPLGFEPEVVLDKVSAMNLQELQKAPLSGLLRDWPNSYTFTKAIAEHLLRRRHLTSESKFAFAIVRPSIVTAAWKEPLPGWIDTINAAAAVYAGVSLGAIKFLPGSQKRILDIVPVDLAVNCILTASAAVLEEKEKFLIVHCCSSSIRPMRFIGVVEPSLDYARRNPPSAAVSKPSFFFAPSNLFQALFYLRYKLPSALYGAISTLGGKEMQRKAAQFDKLVFKLNATVRSFRFFLDNEWIFATENAPRIFKQLSATEQKLFSFDLFNLQWEVYSPVFAYGMIKYVLKDDLIEIDSEYFDHPKTRLNDPHLIGMPDSVPPHKHISVVSDAFRFLLPDTFLFAERASKTHQFSAASMEALRNSVMNSERVQRVIREESSKSSLSLFQLEKTAGSILDRIMGEPTKEAILGVGMVLRKVFKVVFDNIYVNLKGIQCIQKAALKGSVIYVPTHRSYLDFLIVSYVCFFYKLPLPYIAAGEDFLGISVVNHILRYSGAFFMKRSFANDPLYSAIFSEYVHQLLCKKASLEFFIEGTRSRSGKMLHPKLGFLGFILDSFHAQKTATMTLCPVTINFEKTVEGELYRNELQGDRKIKESLQSLVQSLPSLLSSLGRISIHISETPIDVGSFVEEHGSNGIVKQLAYSIVNQLTANLEVMATHLVASLLLMYRQGITYDQLIVKVQWLRNEIILRGGKVAFMEMETIHNVLKRALYHLRYLVVERRENVFEPVASQRDDFRNLLLLGHYRNKFIHLFFIESVWACAYYAIDKETVHHNVNKSDLCTQATFLYKLLCREIVKPDADEFDFSSSFTTMLDNGVFQQEMDGTVSIPHNGETMFSFLCSLCWPFIDSYFVVAVCLFSLQPNHILNSAKFISRAQWLSTTLYHESVICCYESCSIDTLKNAMSFFLRSNVLQFVFEKEEITLIDSFQSDEQLQLLVDRIGQFRKPPSIQRAITRKSLIAIIPMLAKL